MLIVTICTKRLRSQALTKCDFLGHALCITRAAEVRATIWIMIILGYMMFIDSIISLLKIDTHLASNTRPPKAQFSMS
jgi:hypothetical protein